MTTSNRSALFNFEQKRSAFAALQGAQSGTSKDEARTFLARHGYTAKQIARIERGDVQRRRRGR